MRYVSCRDEDGSVADESACVTLPRPVAKEECSVTPCGRWKALDWSPVSEWILGNWEMTGGTIEDDERQVTDVSGYYFRIGLSL